MCEYVVSEYYSDVLLESIMECYDDISNHNVITEKSLEQLFDRIKDFFRDIRIQIENLIRDIKIKFLASKRKKEIKNLIKNYHKNVYELKGSKSTVEMIDLWKYKETYLKMNKELWTIANKFSKVEYQHLEDIDSDLAKFKKIVNKYSNDFESILKTNITVPIDKAIAFYEDELSERGDVIKTLERSMDKFQEMEENAKLLYKRVDRYGVDILPKHMNFIRKMVLTISSIINKVVIKFMSLLILIF